MTSTRKEILLALEEMSQRYPDWRFGQLVANISYWAKGSTTEAVYDIEDEEFLKKIKTCVEQPVKPAALADLNGVGGSAVGNEKKPLIREPNVLPASIWRQHEGKVIVFSEDEQRVIGVGDTEDEAFDQAEASGVEGIWHIHHAARWGEERC